MNKNIDDELSRWIVQLLNKEPFYAHFLGQVTRIISEDIPDGNGGFVQVDYCKSTGGWFLDKEELSALRSIPGIVQIIQTYSSN